MANRSKIENGNSCQRRKWNLEGLFDWFYFDLILHKVI